MNTSDQNKQEALMLEIASLKSNVADLNKYKRAMETQEKLFRSILMMSNVASGRLMLRSILLEVTEVTRELMDAQDASLFILNPKGVITESILARGPTVQEEKAYLIGKTLDQGLAGWVARYRRVALVDNILEDERWLNFPNQPYDVSSALCLPFVRGRLLLGILTLTHPQVNHFTDEMADFMKTFSPSIAIALDHARLYIEKQD